MEPRKHVRLSVAAKIELVIMDVVRLCTLDRCNRLRHLDASCILEDPSVINRQTASYLNRELMSLVESRDPCGGLGG